MGRETMTVKAENPGGLSDKNSLRVDLVYSKIIRDLTKKSKVLK